MEISRLRTFAAVAKTLNFTSAAKELGLTQPAVSHQIKTLENELGEKLFVRGGAKIALTPEGKLVLNYAKKMLGQVDKMRTDISTCRFDEFGTVRLTAITRSMGNPFIELRKVWRKIYKNIELTFDTAMMSESIMENVANGQSDIGFSTLTDDFEGVKSIPWGSFDLALVCGRNHPLASLKTVGLKNLRKEKWILFEKGSWIRRETDKIFSSCDFLPGDVYETNDGSVVRALMNDSFGISLMPLWGLSEDLMSGTLKMVELNDVETKIPVRLVVKDSGRSKIVDMVLEFLINTRLEGSLPVKFTDIREP